MADRKALFVVAGSVVATLLACEVALRLFTPFGNVVATVPAGDPSAGAKSQDPSGAVRYVTHLPAEQGTDRNWFIEDPPPFPRKPVEKKEQDRFDDFVKRGLAGRPAQFAYNRILVGYSGCATSGPFQSFPETVPVFDPPSRTLHPPFRFLPDLTTPEGLVTNRFGFRGPPIELSAPPKTIRVAFVGASTTVNHHSFPFSYPERAVFWLNRFAAANHYDVRFEVINAGREGITSQDIAAVVRYEVAPLNPDLVVYYEGANQFLPNSMLTPYIPRRDSLDPNDSVTGHRLPAWLRRLAIGDLLDRVMLGSTSAGEPRKPQYQLKFPPSMDEQHPNPNNQDLPLNLPRIVKDLDEIRSATQPMDSQLAVGSFVRLAGGGLVLSPVAHRYIYEQLNTLLWPLWYSDIRRLVDFQNRVFRAYAVDRHALFLDIAAQMPQDPSFFADSIHMTDAGERLKAWIVFQQLVPYFRRRIEAGELPRANRASPSPMAPMTITTMNRCDTPPGMKYPLNSLLLLDKITVEKDATFENAKPSRLLTSTTQWGYELVFPLAPALPSNGHLYFHFHARVLKGQIGIGVLDANREFQGERIVDPAPALADIFVPIVVPETARSVILRNTAPGNVRSEMIWDDRPAVLTDQQR